MKIGIIGYKGRLGSQLVSMGCDIVDGDITDEKLRIDLDPTKNIIINCVGKTDVDACEDIESGYYREAISVNGYGIKNLANVWKGEIIHISTDYVFGGKRGPYSEKYLFDKHTDDLPTKKMSYGLTKFVGELTAQQFENVRIVRTTGLYGGVSDSYDFLKMILYNYLHGIEEIKVTKELQGNQTYIPHLAEALIKYTEHKDKPYVLHVASKEVISRYEFALMICSVYGLDKSKIVPVRSDQVPSWIAERPKEGGLKVKLAEKLGLPIYSILEGLEASKIE
jgi:dTDP-4-dehydrorhamnose reductase